MEVEEMQNQSCNFPRIRNGNGRIDYSKLGQKRENQYHDEDGGEVKVGRGNRGGRRGHGGGRGGGGGLDIIGPPVGLGGLCTWPSSRIVRVSRASGGKDRHSKVWTSKGLRDRRVRLSVNTAIQFYDLQDRLGYDQPSKAVEWLLKVAASSISELPLIDTSFPDPPQQLSDEKMSSVGTDQHGFDSVEVGMEKDHEPNFQQHDSFSKSACSSNSETSKGSGGLSLSSRSESRIKARERARERAVEKEKDKNVNPIPQNSSFTELLTGGINGNANGTAANGAGDNGTGNETNLFQKSSPRQWSSSTMDYFTIGRLDPSSSRPQNQSCNGILGQIHMGNHYNQQALASVSSPVFSITGDHHHSEIPRFSFVPDHHSVPVVTTAAAGRGGSSTNNNSGNGEYSLNFTISPSSSSGLSGFNRGTLQSNSLPQIQRFSTPPLDGPSGFYISTTAPLNAAVAPVENHHHHHHFLPRFEATRHSDHKGKGNN